MRFAVSRSVARLILLGLGITLSVSPFFGLQSSNSAVFEPGTSADPFPLAPHAEVVCDPNGQKSLTEAQSSHFDALQAGMPASSKCAAYWIRFAIQANTVPVGGWVLQLLHPWRQVDLYFARDGSVATEHTGLVMTPQTRMLASGHMSVVLPIEAGQLQVFYLRLAGDTTRYGESRSLDASILPLNQWILHQRSTLFGQGIYAGVIAGLVLYNLILFLAIQERVYLYYVLYVISFGTIWIARSGFLFQYLWPSHPRWNEEYLPYVAATAIVFSLLFVREFLATRARSPRVDWLMRGTAVLTVGICVVSFAGFPNLLAFPLAMIGLGVSVLYAVLGLAALVRGYRPARFFLVAWTALLVGNVVYILMFLRVIPMSFFTYNAAQVGSAIECILLAFALADRVNLVKSAREDRQLQYTRELQEKVKQRTVELSDAVERLKTASVTDPLTGLSNRRHVDSAIQPWIADLQRARIRNTPGVPRRSLAVCLADLDHFKQVNDDLGHATGDRVLQAAAELLRQSVRATAILARWGGEEFLVLDHVTGPHEDLLMAERLRRSIIQEDSPVIAESGRLLSLSLGVVRYPFSESYSELLDWDHCLALADHALYRAKKSGRNRWVSYRSNDHALRTVVLELGAEEVRRLLRLHADEAFSLGLIEVVDQVPSDIEVT
jgi:diguanylate cyclase (GGDEF)-like protein